MIIALKTFVGSKLFGLETNNSDTDIKGIYIPSAKDILLHRYYPVIDKSSNKGTYRANKPEDTDEVYFSLDKFIELLIKADTTAFDMLHAPESKILISTDIHHELWRNRSKFYTSRLDGLFGQVIAEANTYGVRSMRAAALKEVVEIVSSWDDFKLSGCKLGGLISQLPVDNVYTRYTRDETQRAGCQDFYEILDRKFQYTISALKFKTAILELWSTYGERVKKVELSGGNDWKALSHAFRIGYQLLDIYREGDYTFPLKQSSTIMKIKLGEVSEEASREMLNQLISDVKTAAGKSGLPTEIDPEPWYDWVADVYAGVVKKAYLPKGFRLS